MNDTINYIPGSLDKNSKIADIPFKSRKKDIDHDSITYQNFLEKKDKISHYLYYDVECLAYVHFMIVDILFSLYNYADQLSMAAANCAPQWNAMCLEGYPPWMNYMNRCMTHPYSIAPTIVSASKMIARQYGLNSRVVTTQYYREMINEVKRRGRVQMTVPKVTNQNWHP